ncbi:hypothetical protein ACB316_17060 [Aeromonas sanarellii]
MKQSHEDTPLLQRTLYHRYYAEQWVQIELAVGQTRLWWVGEGNQVHRYLFDSKDGLLWDAQPDLENNLDVAQAVVQLQESIPPLKGVQWQVPTETQMLFFRKNGTPLRSGGACRVLNRCYWLTQEGRIDLDDGSFSSSSNAKACLLAMNPMPSQQGLLAFLRLLLEQGCRLSRCDDLQDADLLQPLRQPDWSKLYAPIDYLRTRLPMLGPLQFSDPDKGLWEFWGMADSALHEAGVRARNPSLDVRVGHVAIDFGTSSTVVALEQHGRPSLLRVGIGDLWQKEEPAHYENPTVLEFIDLEGMLEAWRADVYQPMVTWEQLRCAHEALTRLRGNAAEPNIVASMLTKIKQWALRNEEAPRQRLRDQLVGVEHELAPQILLNPVKGQALEVGPDYPLDPVELYAWLLGLHINWRGNGLFLRYYMTFPVEYPREVKDRILAAFRRGLQRSLPASLIGQTVFANFCVEARASEPAAYAAAALPLLGIEPDEEGRAYAVFDFGGGTTDFDFGFYRLPDEAENDEDWECVLEHFGAAGDRFLGGENLLENMAYHVFHNNLELCRSKRIAFTRPLDAKDFPGSEMFLERTQAASTNTLMLMSQLRPLWEGGALPEQTGILALELLDRDGQKTSSELVVDQNKLIDYLESRIETGVHNFFAALKSAYGNTIPARVEILLAGNSSRSPIVTGLFGLDPDSDRGAALFERTLNYLVELFDQPLIFSAYRPLAADYSDMYRATGKTGVALGLLRLCPGGVVKVINRTVKQANGEAPFAHHVGKVRRGQFEVALGQGEAYHHWRELGPQREGVFHLCHTQSPRAITGKMCEGEPELSKLRIDLLGNVDGHRLFARAISPNEIEVCSALSIDAVCSGQLGNLRRVVLV